MILGGHEIETIGEEILFPFNKKLLNAASYNFKLGNIILECANDAITHHYIDTKNLIETQKFIKHELTDERGLLMMPGKLYLGNTLERLNLPNNICAQAEGRSSVGRIGMQVHLTAGWLDPGFKGYVTLEISVLHPVWVYPNMEIGQFIFKPCGPNDGYKGHYQEQPGEPVLSRGNFYR